MKSEKHFGFKKLVFGICLGFGASCFVLSLFFFSPLIASAHPRNPPLILVPDKIVPCGYGDLPACDLCQIWHLSDHVINFLIFGIMAPLLVLAIMWGGFTYLTSSGNPKKVEQGTKIMTGAIFGIVISLLSWLIVDTVIKTLADKQVAFGSPTFINFAWNQIAECPLPLQKQLTDEEIEKLKAALKPKPVGLDQKLNAQLAFSLISVAGSNASCKDTTGVPVSAATTLGEVSEQRPVTVCSAGCTGKSMCAPNPQIQISTKMLAELTRLRDNFNFTISSITTGDHSGASCHYAGNCVDVVPQKKQDYTAMLNQLKVLGGNGFCETKSGRSAACPTAGVSDQADPIDHIHVAF